MHTTQCLLENHLKALSSDACDILSVLGECPRSKETIALRVGGALSGAGALAVLEILEERGLARSLSLTLGLDDGYTYWVITGEGKRVAKDRGLERCLG